jgi:hypothetical protein
MEQTRSESTTPLGSSSQTLRLECARVLMVARDASMVKAASNGRSQCLSSIDGLDVELDEALLAVLRRHYSSGTLTDVWDWRQTRIAMWLE